MKSWVDEKFDENSSKKDPQRFRILTNKIIHSYCMKPIMALLYTTHKTVRVYAVT